MELGRPISAVGLGASMPSLGASGGGAGGSVLAVIGGEMQGSSNFDVSGGSSNFGNNDGGGGAGGAIAVYHGGALSGSRISNAGTGCVGSNVGTAVA